jgi:putative ABC transport system permease protein
VSAAELLREALRALLAHRFRSLLTVSSITLGAFSIVLMSSLAGSGLTTLIRDVEELGGARILIFAPKTPEREAARAAEARPLGVRERDHLAQALPHVEAMTLYTGLERREVQAADGVRARTDVVAADAGFFDALGLVLARGRLLSAEDDRLRARVCVVAHELAQGLWGGDAVGRWLVVDRERYLVVGQLAALSHWDIDFGFEWNDFVALPFLTAAATRPEVLAGAALQVRTTNVRHNDVVKRVANAVLIERRGDVDDFQIWDFNAFMAKFHQLFALMQVVVGLLASVALVVGGIGVMNMMLVSVSERTREIGLKKALGAAPGAITRQFLAEAVALSGSGGGLGVVAGVVAAASANALIHHLQPLWAGEISVAAVVVALLASLGIGVGFGYFPARAASRLDAVVALRR